MAKGISKVVVVILLTALLCLIAVGTIPIGSFKGVFNSEHGIRKGFDLAGGSVIVYQASATDDQGNTNPIDASESQMQVAKKILDGRLTRKGYTEGTVTIKGSQLEVELPAVKDTKEAIESIGQTAKLTFEEPPVTAEDGTQTSGAVIMTGDDVKKAERAYTQFDQNSAAEYVVSIEVTQDASQRFYEATQRLVGQPIYIKLDNEVISAPKVNTAINDTSFVIQGDFTKESAEELAALISDGQLPFKLTVAQQRTAGPTLGENALNKGLFAGLIGLIIVLFFMILWYRLPGFMASIALVMYTALCFLLYAVLRVNLSLPGIAGVILSIGMAVDANCIIFERMKEEFRLGKTLRAAADAGFHRALSSIIDSNVTTLISSVVLYFIGSGPIKGFAITLGAGIVVSMFTAIVVTRFLIRAAVEMNISNKFLYGAALKGGNK